MTKLFGTVLVLLAMGLVGCSTLNCGDSHPYLNSVTRPTLKAPAGLSVPPPDPNYAISAVTPTAGNPKGQDRAGACLINPPQLITTQAATAPKPSTAPKSGPVTPAPASGQPMAKPEDKNVTSAPAVSTAVAPPAVAAPGHME